MEEQLISIKVAKLAKEVGFTTNDNSWTLISDGHEYSANCEGGFSGTEDTFKIVTQSLLQKWLREEHEIHIIAHREGIGSDEWDYSYDIEYLPKDKCDVKRRSIEFKYIHSYFEQGGTYIGAWNTYEEALEEGLMHGLKLL